MVSLCGLEGLGFRDKGLRFGGLRFGVSGLLSGCSY